VRNEVWEVVGALAKLIPIVEDPTAAEATAAWYVISLCVDRGYQQVVLEGDSMTVVSALNQSLPNWSSYGQLIKDTKGRLKFCIG
jgi:ribonuclease HI